MDNLLKSLCAGILAAAACASEIPANTWVRLADCPGDAEGREVPPGRASTWAWCPPLQAFLRYGGYSPRFSNALDAFDPASKAWTRIVAEDENYPADRPAGACEALITWDETRACMWIAGGLSTTPSGERGIWRYDPVKRSFAKEAPLMGAGRLAFDAKNGLFIAAPTAYSNGDKGITQVYSLASGKWERKTTNPLPQECYRGNFQMTWDGASGKTIAVGAIKDRFEAWAYDATTSTWEVLASEDGPPGRAICALAYDPGAKQVMLFGGSDGQYGEYIDKARVWNDTWYLDVAAKKWREIKTPGPTPLTSLRRGKPTIELTYRLGLAWNPQSRCMALMDPDLGVWQFRHDADAPPGKDCQAGGFTPVVGAAARNAPAKGPPEIRRTLPSPLNPRLVELPDNTLMPLKGSIVGDEIAWGYDKDAGVLIKYGGCGNGASPYWSHYGNDLALYDPGTESVLYRRVGDVSGQARPANGCTRLVTYDAKRKLSWFFGGVASGPYAPYPPGTPEGYYTYDAQLDRFTLVRSTGSGANQNCHMVWSPDHDLAINPAERATQVFDFATAAWSSRPSAECPGPMYVYQRLAYVASKRAFLRLVDGATGRTSAEKPADALSAKDAAGKAQTYWSEDKAAKLWREKSLRTFLYDPSANTWTDLKPAVSPPFRDSKYGLVYDAKNDAVILVGGDIGWNGPACNDMWAYSVTGNEWSRIEPQYAPESKQRVNFQEAMMSDYDSRHNVIIFRSARVVWAYRYRK